MALQAQSVRVHDGGAKACQQEQLGAHSSKLFLALRVPWALWGDGFDGDSPLRAECFKVSVFTKGLVVGFYICSRLLWEEASLMRVEWSLIFEHSGKSLGIIISLHVEYLSIIHCGKNLMRLSYCDPSSSKSMKLFWSVPGICGDNFAKQVLSFII